MREYTVRAEKTGESVEHWYVKIENTAPTSSFDNLDDAIAEGKKLAEENKPSRLVIYNHLHEIVDEHVYK
ncbi:DUF2188 domain-containing protein [Evansella clarkii]|uniref:DUF2188 domain-containing protein n=1 Tax=Evansella clarkii TaxID=79879 RepID=UPI000997CDEB|nr:DUF2188 domain-containing protein [Evansella clarkii]